MNKQITNNKILVNVLTVVLAVKVAVCLNMKKK